MPLWKKTTDSRKYVDLLANSTSPRIANIDPSFKITIGDFGKLDRETGRFMSEGNIGNLGGIETADLETVEDEEKQYEIIKQGTVREISPLNVEAAASLTGVLDFSLSTSFQYGEKRSAVLLMLRPRTTRYKYPRALAKHPALQKKLVITEVVHCTAYYLCLSHKAGMSREVSLRGLVPIPVAPVSAGGGLGTSAQITNAGLLESLGDSDNKSAFVPLFTLQGPGKLKLRGARSDEDYLWLPLELPWDDLDEEGNEIETPEAQW